MKNKLQPGQQVFFHNEKLPFEIKAVSERYAVVSRKLNRREDASLLHHQVEMSAYSNFTEAFNANKDNPVYSILDFKTQYRGPDNLVLGGLDYFDVKDCKKAIKWLETSKIEISRRNKVELNIDWGRTNFKK